MITEIAFENFRTLRSTTVPLRPPISVLLGPNNAGKSTALLALDLLREIVATGSLRAALEKLELSPESLLSRGSRNCRLRIVGEFSNTIVKYSLRFDKNANDSGDEEVELSTGLTLQRRKDANASSYSIPGIGGLNGPLGALLRFVQDNGPPNYAPIKEFAEFLARTRVFHLSVAALRSESAITKNPVLSRSGDNIAAVVDWLQSWEPDTFARIEADVRQAAPEVRAVRAVATANNKKLLAAQLSNGMFEASSLSDGLVLFIALSVATGGNVSPALIAVEEPERGVHPRRLREVLDAFKRAANRGTQIVLTTHSPLVLDEFRDQPERVLIFEPTESGTVVGPLSARAELKDLEGQSLGDAWYSGILGGVPAP